MEEIDYLKELSKLIRNIDSLDEDITITIGRSTYRYNHVNTERFDSKLLFTYNVYKKYWIFWWPVFVIEDSSLFKCSLSCKNYLKSLILR